MNKSPNPTLCRRACLAMVLPALLALASCGGGVSISGSDGDGSYYVGGDYEFDFTRPSVSIAVAESEVKPGQLVHIAAAASDESGIDGVTLYRVDQGGDRLVGELGRRPYEWSVAAPSDGRGSVSYFVQAMDNAGNRAKSSTVTVAIITP